MTPPVDPTLDVERELLLTAPVVIGVDEVGRGAIAAPSQSAPVRSTLAGLSLVPPPACATPSC